MFGIHSIFFNENTNTKQYSLSESSYRSFGFWWGLSLFCCFLKDFSVIRVHGLGVMGRGSCRGQPLSCVVSVPIPMTTNVPQVLPRCPASWFSGCRPPAPSPAASRDRPPRPLHGPSQSPSSCGGSSSAGTVRGAPRPLASG